MRRPVVVTGLGLVSPLRPFEGLEAFWDALCNGEDSVKKRPAPMLDAEGEWPVAAIDSSRLPEGTGPAEKFTFMAGEALDMALKDSGLTHPEKQDPGGPFEGQGNHAVGMVVGTVLGNILSKELRMMQAGGPTVSAEKEFLHFIGPYLAQRIGLRGGLFTVSTACASGTDAVGFAARKIAGGHCDLMVAGGVDVLSDFALFGFHGLQALTHDKVRPFDRNRTGLALGEGAAFLVLETKEQARERGAKIYGEILGYSSRADAHHLTGPHREGRGLADAVASAMAEASLRPADIDYINAHGTGTVYNDLMETVVVKKIFGDFAYTIPISSTKSMLGHSFGAAGAIEAICCLLAIRHNIIPPTINFSERDPECDLDYVPNTPRRKKVRTAMSLSAGFGGQNAVLLMGAV